MEVSHKAISQIVTQSSTETLNLMDQCSHIFMLSVVIDLYNFSANPCDERALPCNNAPIGKHS